jgi:lipid-binding SYLF domain-containing protein
MKADILSWSRSQGVFAGVALEGATLRQDLDDNATLYGKKIENRDIVRNGQKAPAAAQELLNLLNKHSAHESGSAALRPAYRPKTSPWRTQAQSSLALRR